MNETTTTLSKGTKVEILNGTHAGKVGVVVRLNWKGTGMVLVRAKYRHRDGERAYSVAGLKVVS